MHGVEQLLDFRVGHLEAAEFNEGVAQRHRRARNLAVIGAQSAHALAFFAEVYEVKKKTEGVRNIRGRGNAKPLDLALVRVQKIGIDAKPNLLGEMPEVLDRLECLLAALFLNNRAEAGGQQTDFMSKRFNHGK